MTWLGIWAYFMVEGGIPVPTDPSVWKEYGPATVSAIVFALFAGYMLKAMMDQNKELRADNKALNEDIRKQIVPVLTQFMAEAARLTQVTAETTRVLQTWRDRDR